MSFKKLHILTIALPLIMVKSFTANAQCRDTIKVSGVTAICKGRSTKITLNNPTSTYTWQPGNLTGVQQTLAPAVTTAYTIKSDDGAGCTDSIQLVISVNQAPAVSAAFSSTPCPGSPINATFTDSVSALYWKSTGKDTFKTVITTWNSASSAAAGGNGAGTTSNKLRNPDGVFVDVAGNVYVSDKTNNRIQKWAPGATSGTTVAGGHGAGSAANQLSAPAGIFVDASGNIYIADLGNSRIQKWAPGAVSGTTVAGGNGYGSNNDQLASPFDVFVDAAGNILIADQDNARVQLWREGDAAGITVAGGNGDGGAANQLSGPSSVFEDIGGNIFVADAFNNRVQKWAPSAITGVTVAGSSAGTAGADNASLDNPQGIWIDGLGNLYIADQGNLRIQQWAKGAVTGTTVAATGIVTCTDVLLDATGSIYVADAGHNDVKKYTHAALSSNYTPLATKTSYRVWAQAFNGCYASSNYVAVKDTVAPKLPVAIIGNAGNLCNTSSIFSVKLDKTVTNYNWVVPAGAAITSGQGKDSVSVSFSNTFTSGNVSVTAANACAISKPVSVAVTAVPATPQKLNGLIGINSAQKNIKYFIYPLPKGAAATGVTYTWSVPADAAIKSGQGTNTVYVNWGKTNGNVDVYASNTCGSSGVLHTAVTILTPFSAGNVSAASLTSVPVGKPGLYVLPNPVVNTARLHFNMPQAGKYTITVADISGKVALRQQSKAAAGDNFTELNIQSLAGGIYTVTLYSNGYSETCKLVKR